MENKPLRVIFALPGNQYSGNFLQCWTQLLNICWCNNIQPILSQFHSPLLYYVRNMCLGGDILQGTNQKPFNNEIDYDYIMWIDSDIIFSPNHFLKLLSHKKDIVSGLYMMSDNKHFATVKDWNENFFIENGHFQFLTPKDIENKKDLFPVSYTGFGWILIKRGVFESLQYPWFQPMWSEFKKDNKVIKDFSMEDAAFCKMIQEKGYNIYIDPEIIVGHEKTVIL